MAVEFDIPAFRVAFPQFSSEVLYPDGTIQAQAENAACFLAAAGHCGCETYQMQLMVAHLLLLATRMATGTGGGVVTSATIDKVSVGIQAPPGKTAFTYWLNTTPYGQQLAALLAVCGAGGLYIGGLPERAAFRSVGGLFPRGGRIWPR